MTPRGGMVKAVDDALAAAKIRPQDKATAELARRYAALLDEVTPASKYRAPLRAMEQALAMLGRLGEPYAAEQAEPHLAKIADALAAHSVASDLGPKLLAALTALGLTPAAVRDAAKGGAAGAVAAPAGPAAPEPEPPREESEFERLRREREQRTRANRA